MNRAIGLRLVNAEALMSRQPGDRCHEKRVEIVDLTDVRAVCIHDK